MFDQIKEIALRGEKEQEVLSSDAMINDAMGDDINDETDEGDSKP